MADQTRNLDGNEPPHWMQRLLLLLLAERDERTVPSDLLEEYGEEKLRRLGKRSADLWYLRQVISIAGARLKGGPMLKQTLALTCLFTIAAAVWLGVMENVLKHSGYGLRMAVAACIAVQGLLTLAALTVRVHGALRVVVLAGALGIAYVGFSALVKDLRDAHFEGFVLVIGTALIIQAALTVAVLLVRGLRGPVLRSS